MKQGTAAYAKHEQLVAEARAYKAEGHSHDEVAEKFGKSKAWSCTWCKGIAPQGDRPVKNIRNQFTSGSFDRVANAKRIIAEHYPNFEYVGGFTHVDGRVVVRCRICGTEREVSMVTMRHNGSCVCRTCEKNKHDNRDAVRKATAKVIRKQVVDARRFNRGQQMAFRFCECGTLIPSSHRTCETCKRTLQNRRDNLKKDKRRVAAFTKDTHTISLAKLFERDGGVCWLCGELCDYTADINGNMYPSIDHVVPISKGGKDEWSNIKLAHRICNAKRGNRAEA